MLDSAIPAKTESGRLEIDQRKLKIGARQRMVLISINGERSVESIRKQFVAISDIDSLLKELLSSGLIEFDGLDHALEHDQVITAPPPDLASNAKPAVTLDTAEETRPVSRPTPPPAAAKAPARGLVQAREYMSQTLSAKVGFRAFLFGQKIEKSNSPEALREHMSEFRRLLRKSLDASKVAEISAHVEELLGND